MFEYKPDALYNPFVSFYVSVMDENWLTTSVFSFSRFLMITSICVNFIIIGIIIIIIIFVYLHCAVSVIVLLAVDSAHK
jgi:uncharacterized membrane protein